MVRGCTGRDPDPDQTALGLGSDQLASFARNRALGCGRLPLPGCAEPDDRFFIGRDMGGARLDLAGVDDRAEVQAGCVVEERGWIVAVGEMVGGGLAW